MTIAPRRGDSRIGGGLGSALAALGTFCWRHPRSVLLAWLLAALAAGFLAERLTDRLLSGFGDLQGSMSLHVDKMLRSDFGRSDSQSLILVFRSASMEKSPIDVSALSDDLQRRLATQPSVATAIDERDIQDRRLQPKTGSGHLLIVQLKTNDLLATEQQVAKLRAAVAPALETAEARHGDLEWALTGRAALTNDLNKFDNEDTALAEGRALPLTLVVLVFAFGSIVSAMLPLILAFVSRTLVLGIVFLFAGSVEVSNLVPSVVTMLSIALGIDYSLFLIHRYRRELDGTRNEMAAAAREEAMRGAMAQSGVAVLYSGATVAIGIGSLLTTPLMQTRSIGLGGLCAVIVTVAASLTLVPAFLQLIGPSVLEWPRSLSRLARGDRSRRFWTRLANGIEDRPLLAILASMGVLLALAAPALQTRIGFPEGEFLPAELEFSRGMEMLTDMRLRGLISPIVVLLTDMQGERALTPDRAPALADFVARMDSDTRVAAVQGPVQPSAAGGGTMEAAVGGALMRQAFISHDRTRLMLLIIPSNDATLAQMQDLSASIPGALRIDGLSVAVGGQAQYYSDFDKAVRASYPLTIGLVLCMSALVLLLLFRAPLASAKALVLNLLSVAAGYGVVVLVFQLGFGSGLLGVPAPTGVVPITVPLAIFCILFGLSMDYEIFLLSQVRTIFDETRDNARSIREALADTGAVITSAALIMVAVFGAFAFARDVVVQMIGLGLAVAVLVDAALIRSILGPALMHVAGRWNWWPAR